MNLQKYNPFPPAVWILMFLSLDVGFFLGSYIQSKAIQQNDKNTCDYIQHQLSK